MTTKPNNNEAFWQLLEACFKPLCLAEGEEVSRFCWKNGTVDYKITKGRPPFQRRLRSEQAFEPSMKSWEARAPSSTVSLVLFKLVYQLDDTHEYVEQ